MDYQIKVNLNSPGALQARQVWKDSGDLDVPSLTFVKGVWVGVE